MTAIVAATVHVVLALQANQANVRGTVRDAETSEPLRAAVVVLTDLDRFAVADDSGRYVLHQVPAGPQHISVSVVGYGGRTLHALVPPTGELEINVALRAVPIPLGPLSVQPAVPLRGIDSHESDRHSDREMSIAAIRNHPALAELDVLQALSGGEVVVMPESPSGVHIRGSAADQTAYVLDGIPILSPYHAAGVFSAWNPDALSLMQLSASFPRPIMPDALAGVIAATTRSPGSRFSGQGSISTTQARFTADGPLGREGAGYLVSLRTSYPGIIAPRDEGSYLGGESSDVLTKVEAPALGGSIRLIGYDSKNEIDAAAAIDSADTVSPDQRRNAFEWHSRSVGLSWARTASRTTVEVRGWSAAADAGASWGLESGVVANMASERRDEGLLVAVEHRSERAATGGGVRILRSATSYRVASGPARDSVWAARSSTPVAAMFVEHTRNVNVSTQLDFAAALAAAAGGVHFGPRAQVRWAPSEKLALSLSAARLLQFAQSLRNAESIIGNIFPVDLYVGAGDAGVPAARSDQAVVMADYRPRPGWRTALQAYQRKASGVVLVPPRDDEPFVVTDFTTGSGTARGFALDFAMASSRYGVVGSYGWQRTRFEYGDSSYVPEFAAVHNVETGVIIFPTATSSVRMSALAAFGRRATRVTSSLEWEACNLLDRGCEFAGSPRSGAEQLGGTRLPAYLRVDVGFRKHWHVALAHRDATLALFGTVTNLFGRRNTLNYASDPATGERAIIEMRPRSPLVVGVDWRF